MHTGKLSEGFTSIRCESQVLSKCIDYICAHLSRAGVRCGMMLGLALVIKCPGQMRSSFVR